MREQPSPLFLLDAAESGFIYSGIRTPESTMESIPRQDSLTDTLLAVTRDAVAVCGDQLRIERINSAFTEHTGFEPAHAVGLGLAELLGNDQASWGDLSKALASSGTWEGELDVRREDGSAARMSVRCRRTADGSDAPGCVILFAPAQAHGDPHLSQYDRLTGLPGAPLFLDRVDQALIGASRTGRSVSLLLIGLDRFFLVNDGLGRSVGDRVLKAIAERLASSIRRSDTVARLGGDRFGLVMPIADNEDSVLVADKVLKALHAPIVVDQHQVSITASIGIGIFPDDSSQRGELISHAESAMRYIKNAGGNHYPFFSSEMNLRARQRIQLEHRLRQALQNQELLVYYQPKVSLEDNSVVGAEALVRWLDPDEGMIPPGQFIPVAEESGLIGPIGDLVLRTACRQNSAWRAKGLTPTRVSVNVTASQFRDRALVDKVRSALDDTGLPPEYLELEITESMLIGDMDQVVEKLNALRSLGVHIAIDDFGTGYSSLSYLSRFPITTLKIDQSFVRDMESNARTAEITNAIIGLSRGLSLEVVAEGAESIEHVRLLREQSCDLVQGFYYSRAVPADELEQILAVRYLYDR